MIFINFLWYYKYHQTKILLMFRRKVLQNFTPYFCKCEVNFEKQLKYSTRFFWQAVKFIWVFFQKMLRYCDSRYALMVKRSRRSPLKAESGVRFPLGVPNKPPFVAKNNERRFVLLKSCFQFISFNLMYLYNIKTYRIIVICYYKFLCLYRYFCVSLFIFKMWYLIDFK